MEKVQSLFNCPKCNKKIWMKHYFCPKCGLDLRENYKKKQQNGLDVTYKGRIEFESNKKQNKITFFNGLKMSIYSFLTIILFYFLAFSYIDIFGSSKFIEINFGRIIGLITLIFIFSLLYSIYRLIIWKIKK